MTLLTMAAIIQGKAQLLALRVAVHLVMVLHMHRRSWFCHGSAYAQKLLALRVAVHLVMVLHMHRRHTNTQHPMAAFCLGSTCTGGTHIISCDVGLSQEL